MKYKATVVAFDKVSGWADGPMKPTVTESSGTASTVASAVASATNSSTLGGMAAGEVIQVIITAESDS